MKGGVGNWTQAALAADGFTGFVQFAALPESDVPRGPGVYVVIRSSTATPVFLEQSPAGWLKGQDPSVSIAVLEEAWVPGAAIVYIGKANTGRRGRRGLYRRLDEYRRFGAGDKVPHRGGRHIWQLADHQDLLVGWKPTADEHARLLEREMIAAFRAAHGKRPFANLVG